MRALCLVKEKQLEVLHLPPPGPGEVQIRVRAVALNHLDVWGRGMSDTEGQLSDVSGAFKRMEDRQVVGKIIIQS